MSEDQRAAVHSLDHFALEVPDLEAARVFYDAMGLKVTEHGDGLELRAHGSDHVWGRLSQGPRKRLHHLSFGAYEADLPAFAARASGARTDAPAGSESEALWLRGFDDVLIEIAAKPKRSPDLKATAALTPSPAGERGARLGKADLRAARPARLSHCLLFTSSIDGAIGFYEDMLGLRLSDRSGDVVAFMHGVHGSDHHMLGFAGSRAPGFHHCSWDVPSLDDVVAGSLLMADKGYAKGWGVGRHVIGSNYFHYVQDPWGGFAEYSYDIDYIPAGHTWSQRDFVGADALALWGPPPPDDFTHNYEAD
jgi:catechol 2,3-dioxygenase